MATHTAPADAAAVPLARRGAGRFAAATLRHGLMWAAMVPCAVGGPRSVHIGALLTLMVLAAWCAVRTRRDERELPDLLDVVVMVFLALAATLAHGGHGTGHQHGGSAETAATTIVGLGIAGWIVLRASCWKQTAGSPHRLLALCAAIAMIAMMSAPVLLRMH